MYKVSFGSIKKMDLKAKLRPPSGSFSQDFAYFKEIHPLLQELRQKEPYEHPEPDMEGLREWLQKHGVWNSKLEIRKSPSMGYGVVALDEIKKDTVLVEIPQSLMITSIPEGKLQSVIEGDKILSSMPSLVLILRLIEEVCNPSSFWRPYLRSLPSRIQLPMFFDPNEIESLKGLSVQHDCIKDILLSLQQYFLLIEIADTQNLLKGTRITMGMFEWARSIVLTRQNPIQSLMDDTVILQLALIPYFDLFNHQSGPITSSFDLEVRKATLRNGRDSGVGEELFMSYGTRSNQELFMFCGFVGNDCTHDRLRIPLMIPKNDPCRQEKETWLNMYGIGLSEIVTLDLHCLKPSTKFYLMLILILMNAEQLSESRRNRKLPIENTPPELVEKAKKWIKTRSMVQVKLLELHKGNCDPTVEKLRARELEFWIRIAEF
jgi:histone-lysine N-methyltransferase SETD3